MYAALWRRLPGPVPVKILQVVVLALIVVGICFRWVFPWVEEQLPYAETTVDAAYSQFTPHPRSLT